MDFDAFDEDWNDADAGCFGSLDDLVHNDKEEPDQQIRDESTVGHGEGASISEELAPYPILLHSLDETSFDFPQPVIQNVIASVNLSTELDLRLIAISARNAEYNPTKVNAVVRYQKCNVTYCSRLIQILPTH